MTSPTAVIAVRHGQGRAVAGREVDVGVRMDATAEIEVGPGKEAQVVLREEPELKDRDGDRLQGTPHADFGAAACGSQLPPGQTARSP